MALNMLSFQSTRTSWNNSLINKKNNLIDVIYFSIFHFNKNSISKTIPFCSNVNDTFDSAVGCTETINENPIWPIQCYWSLVNQLAVTCSSLCRKKSKRVGYRVKEKKNFFFSLFRLNSPWNCESIIK